MLSRSERRLGVVMVGILRHRRKLVLMDSHGHCWASIRAVISALPEGFEHVTESHIVAHCCTENRMAHFALSPAVPNRRIRSLANHSYGPKAAPPCAPRATPPVGPGGTGPARPQQQSCRGFALPRPA